MSAPPRRRSPRRPFTITPQGLKRIRLGETGDGAPRLVVQHRAAEKPLRAMLAPSGSLLVVVHSDRGAVDAHGQQAIAAAALLADAASAVVVLVLGTLGDDLAAFGADKVIVVPECGEGSFNPERELAVVGEMVAEWAPRHILLPDNLTGDGDLGRRLAARLGVAVAGHVVELGAGGVAAYRSGGAVLARRTLPAILLLDAETTDTALPFCGAGERVTYRAPMVEAGPYRDGGLVPIEAAQLALEEADFIVSGGNGVGDVQTLEALAAGFGAAVGASRVAVDDGRFARAKQIGATGKTVSANVYLAIGISGAVQHLQGIRACRHVIAINTDASAPMVRRADLTIVGDAQPVMEQLLDAMHKRNRSVADVAAGERDDR